MGDIWGILFYIMEKVLLAAKIRIEIYLFLEKKKLYEI
jgi:hypothetical protein